MSNDVRTAALGVVPALVVGLAIMLVHDAAWSRPLVNLGAAVAGFVVLLTAGLRLGTWIQARPHWVSALIVGLCAASLATPGIDGVRRWLPLPGFNLHPAAILAPVLLLAIAVMWHRGQTVRAICFVIAGLAIHAVQPDAGQATAFAAGVGVLAVLPGNGWKQRLLAIITAVAGATCAWLRPDPLAPVDMVENMVPRAFQAHPALGVLSVVALAFLPAAALWQAVRDSEPANLHRASGLALAAYFLASIAVVAFGVFPTPLLGYGASPIVGAILGVGLAHAPRKPEPAGILEL